MIFNVFSDLQSGGDIDAKILAQLFQSPPHDLWLYSYQNTSIRNADISIHIDYVNPVALNMSTINVLIVALHSRLRNIKDYLSKIDYVLCKTDATEEHFHELVEGMKKKPRIEYVGWTSFTKDGNNNLKARNKPLFYTYVDDMNVEKCIELVKDWPLSNNKLTVYSFMSKDNPRVLDLMTMDKINFFVDYDISKVLKNSIYIVLEKNKFPIDIYEELSSGNVVLVPDKAPYNEFIKRRLVKAYSLKNVKWLNEQDGDYFEKIFQKSKENFYQLKKDFFERTIQFFTKLLKRMEESPEPEKTCFDVEPRVSIITPTYNRSNLFHLAIENWERIEWSNKEWIIIDDTDDSREKEYMAKFKDKLSSLENIHYITLDSKHTIAEKRNIGIEKATGEFIMCMDDDDFYPAKTITNRLDKMGNLDCLYCSSIACYDIIQKSSFINTPSIYDLYYKRISEASLFFRKEFWENKPFNVSVEKGEGEDFIKGRLDRCKEVDWKGVFISLRHDKNISEKENPLTEPNGCHFVDEEWGFTQKFLDSNKYT